ncbi:hypothetical protein [Intestinibacter bartlettii]|uniref:Uncharacterized protein n=1 Tax=Intestinibacter bartlettii TaxID=261299 RepID=A0ABS6E097_9FIRM|nr:hypothetical protein [Intestinibacter bartlettii]MBU5337407.1 hypothetical protein [Intestinibacter bartlettii]
MIRTILKRWWNLNMKIGCFMPIIGIFFKHLIIAQTEKEIQSKNFYIDVANISYSIMDDFCKEYAFETLMKEEIYRRTNCNNITFNSTADSVKIDNGNWIDISHIKRNFFKNFNN